MIANDFKIAFRTIAGDKLSSLINLIGLTLALAGVCFILFYVRSELGTDNFHTHADRVVRLTQQVTRNGQTTMIATTAPPMGPALKTEMPEVAEALRLRYTDESTLRYGDLIDYEDGLWYADSTFFQFFDFPLASGHSLTALSEPHSVVLTPRLAAKYFGTANPLGKVIEMDGNTSLKVTGVLKDDPYQTHLNFSMLVSFETFRVPAGYPVDMNSWHWGGFHTYLLLTDASQATSLEGKLSTFLDDKFEPNPTTIRELHLQNLSEVYFQSANMYGANRNHTGNLTYVKGLSLVALLILLVAIFNFTNLSLARSVRRAREVSVRKILGASSMGLFRLFLFEALVISAAAILGGIFLLELGKQTLSSWLGWNLHFQLMDIIYLLPFFLALLLFTTFTAGWFPAYFFTRVKAVEVMKGDLKTGAGGHKLRKWLVGIQFFLMISLLAGALIVKQQMDFLQHRDVGFDRDQVVALQLPADDFLAYYEPLRQRLLQYLDVLSVSAGDVFNGNNGSQPITLPGSDQQEPTQMDILGSYYDYFQTIGVPVKAGREFSQQFPNDTTSGVILNEMAVKRLGLTDPIGQRIRVGDIKTDAEIVGVVENFHYRSLHEPIKPLAIFVPETVMRYVLVRIKAGQGLSALSFLQDEWKAHLSDFPFDLSFLDERLQNRYIADQNFSHLVYLFTGLTLFIAIIGLYGLVAILLSFRLREIGIRKVLGASALNLVQLLSKDFMLIVGLSLLAAIPVSYYFMDRWLEDFAYRIDIGWWAFLLAGLAAVVVCLLTVSAQSIRASLVNPVETLRDE